MKKLDLKNMNISELENLFLSIGEKKFRAKQLFKYIHKENKNDLDEITVLSKDLREKLKEFTEISDISILKRIDSKIDKTKKYIFKLYDNNIIESVYMESKANNTICISTQVGCKMGCVFCASTQNGYSRNLSAAEILSQVYKVERDLNKRIDNIVLMGIGEPFDNFDNVLKFIKIINSDDGHNTGIRNITISTSGIISGIDKLAKTGLQVNLAISLHNGIQKEREDIMPIAKGNKLTKLHEALLDYQNKTGRRISYEYVVIKDVNDSYDHARYIKSMCSGLDAHVNLISLNKIDEYNKQAARDPDIQRFKEKLENLGINTTIRRKQGSDIDAACGQLRNKYETLSR
ncbi:MAG: 23S rRNA (adenine(2503)-C(2))-methyltransferase RlmN [Tissierellia bacterium]|nr:23S rRNA (adenine(2503)-C(2))-methyltransferase RlmN [Tissierellia bacterium]